LYVLWIPMQSRNTLLIWKAR